MDPHSLTPADILGPNGRIAARLKNYEERTEQLEMAATVAEAIAEQKHLIVEAGRSRKKICLPWASYPARDAIWPDKEPQCNRRRVTSPRRSVDTYD